MPTWGHSFAEAVSGWAKRHLRRCVRETLLVVQASPNRRKLRMVRPGAVPDDLVVVVRATPPSVEEAVGDIARDALQSGRTYLVRGESGELEPLYGVSVFAHRPELAFLEFFARFDEAAAYLEAQVGELRSAGFVVLPTGASPDHFDVQLLSGQGEEAGEPIVAVRAASARLVAAAGELRPNPAYHEDRDRTVEEE